MASPSSGPRVAGPAAQGRGRLPAGDQEIMNKLTEQTRDAAYQRILPLAQNREERAFQALREHPGGLTAGEVAEVTGLPLNGARSALTTLLDNNRVTTMSKRICTSPKTSKKVRAAVWTLPIPQ